MGICSQLPITLSTSKPEPSEGDRVGSFAARSLGGSSDIRRGHKFPQQTETESKSKSPNWPTGMPGYCRQQRPSLQADADHAVACVRF